MLSASRFMRRILGLSVVALLGRTLVSLADPSCISPWPEQLPADGPWKGSFSLSYQMKNPGAPPIKVKWTGDLNFALASEKDTANVDSFKQRCWRVPLGSKPQQGCEGVIGPIWVQEVRTIERPGRPHILGRANAAMQFDFAMSSGKGNQFNFSAPTQAPVSLRTVAEVSEDLPPNRLLAIQLMGSQGQLNLATAMSATSTSGRVTGAGKASGTGSTSMSGVARENGHVESYSVAHQANQQNDNEKQMFRLKLEHSDCWLMKGQLDTTQIAASMQGGMQAENFQSEWEATLQERDIKFEQEVEHFIQEPVPTTLTWEYVDRTKAELERLVGDQSSGYRACVAAKAMKKVVELEERELQFLMKDYPKVSQGATAPVLCAANERLFTLMRDLTILTTTCPLVDQATTLVVDEWDALVAKLKIRKDLVTCSRL